MKAYYAEHATLRECEGCREQRGCILWHWMSGEELYKLWLCEPCYFDADEEPMPTLRIMEW